MINNLINVLTWSTSGPKKERSAGSRKQSVSKYNVLSQIATIFLISNISEKTMFVNADQPVHCLRGQLYGVWKFHVSQDANMVNLFEVDEVCTHKLPNKLQIIGSDHQFAFQKDDVWKVKLMDKFQAEAVLCKDGGSDCSNDHITGTWSTIYDQSFKIELDNGVRFLSNFKYTLKPNISKDPEDEPTKQFTQLKTGDYNKFDSHCDKTMVGFVQNIPSTSKEQFTMTQHKISCFYGVQETHYDMEKTVSVKTESDTVKVAVITSQNKIETQPVEKIDLQLKQTIRSAPNSRFNAHIEHEPSAENDKAISFINNNDFGWKADTCKHTKDHPEYGAHCNAQNSAQSLAQVETESQSEKQKKEFGAKGGAAFKKAMDVAHSWRKKYSTNEDIPDKVIPDNYDLRSIEGFDFTGPMRDQGACGSCYSVSFTQVIESRLKFNYAKKVPVLSPQYLMQCNYLTEGCDGGWSFFHGYLAENGYMVSEKCAPYKAKTKGTQCGEYKDCKPIARIKESYFIGGAYGESSEKKMMKEILRNGIVNGELNVPRIFSFYQKGILSNDHEAKMSQYLEYSGVAEHHKQAQQMIGVKQKKKLTDRDLEDYGIAWMNLNHSVVIVGWGVDDQTGTKYWIVRNSYGKRWGMEGDFLVRRGENDFGIESETTGYNVELCDENKSSPGQCVPQQQ